MVRIKDRINRMHELSLNRMGRISRIKRIARKKEITF
jgi:hypothetical protein